MLHTELLRLINTRETWALVGSGASIDAGCASWEQLLSAATAVMNSSQLTRFQGETRDLRSGSDGGVNLPIKFSVVESILGREALDDAISSEIRKTVQPGSLHRLLADLPFAGYVTTNYDHLLEKALNGIEPGWAPVGNVGDEVRKASGTAERVVWHVHGGVDLGPTKSKLVLTSEDYDEIYLDESRVLKQLQGVLANRRIAIVGFGFRDDDVMRLLKFVGRLTDATRPIFALVEKAHHFNHTTDRAVFLRQYKIDVQPYKNNDGRHQSLRTILAVYSSLSLRRSLRYGQHLSSPPSYDPETTGLLLYNDLVLKNPHYVPEELKTAILKARILSLCENSQTGIEDLRADLDGLVETLTRRVLTPASKEETDSTLRFAIDQLQEEGLLLEEPGGYILTPTGKSVVLDHSAAASRMEDQFRASVTARTENYSVALGVDAAGPSKVICAFFSNAIERRALGVALAFATGGTPGQQEYHALALLQTLSDLLDNADSPAEALVVTQAIQQIFQAPTDAEKVYIGTAVQARFMLHLLSLDEDTLRVRQRELQESVMIVDSSVLIPLLASKSTGHDGAVSLFSKLNSLGVFVGATWPIIEEVAEHARWVQKQISDSGGAMTSAILSAATGRAGIKTNAFLEGYVKRLGSSIANTSFNRYLAECLGQTSVSDPLTEADVAKAMNQHRVHILDIASSAAGDQRLAALRDRYLSSVRTQREQSGSFKHERQVRAEAEIVALVERVRLEAMEIDGKSLGNAYFISNSSFLNRLAGHPSAITLRPEAALAWLATLNPATTDDSRAIISELLWELQERRMNLVDQSVLLETFGPLITGARKQLEELIPKYQALMAGKYAGDAPSVLQAIPDLNLPVVLEGVRDDRVHELERELKEMKESLEEATGQAAIAESDRLELEASRRREEKRRKYINRMRRMKGQGSSK
jgi:hypothetical protein